MGFAPDKQKHKSRNKGQTVAEEKVLPLQRPQMIGSVTMEHGQIYVAGHDKSP